MAKFQSTKLFDGFSTVFRQWKAEGTHCKFLHGYGVSFRVWFEGELDERNWVWDFGGMKRAKGNIDGKNPKEWMDYMFDHTTIVATDDPGIGGFRTMNELGIIQLREIEAVGAEQFAKYIFEKLNWIKLINDINHIIKINSKTIRKIEDKQIGVWFIKPDEQGEIPLEQVKYKLMFYLWDSVFGRDKNPLEEIISKAVKKEIKLITYDDFVRHTEVFLMYLYDN